MLERRDLLAVLVDVGYHLVEPNTSGQTVSLSVVSSSANDKPVAGFDLRAQIVTAKDGPNFEGVRFAGDLWSTFPHIESGGPFPSDTTLASGDVAFTQGFEARADGTLVKLTIDTTGIAAGSYEFRLVGTQLGSSNFRRADGSGVSEVITNGTLHVRSIWQNPDNPNDINGDGRISPLDVLLLLNKLSKKGSYELDLPLPGQEPEPYLDVNGDGYLSPKDPLGIINCLNGLGCITSPPPILAQVTPDFPDSTGAGNPNPDNPDAETTPEEETDPEEPIECPYYELDDEGAPIIDPDFCAVEVEPTPDPFDPTPRDPASELNGSVAVPGVPHDSSLVAQPTINSGIATVLPANAVDSAIADLAEELSGDEAATEDLIDLGLGGVFAVS
ncbi:MAG: hypothetical protein H8E66_02700 [Planctomycetes bacterium]|nr:hypothetical protein [Planctomycetota bacterium]